MMKKFFQCEICGKIVQVESDGKGSLQCCGKPMTEMTANSKEAAVEKHIPEVSAHDNTISVVVGSVLHPATEAHHIDWIYLESQNGGQFRHLNPLEEPKAEFVLAAGDQAKAVYAYCNLHGLWVKEL